MARKPKAKEEAAVQSAPPTPGTKIRLPDGKVKTFHEGGIVSIDN